MSSQWHPSNGTEGEAFICRNCAYCARDANEDCEILARSFREPVEQWRQFPDGRRICTAFVPDGEEPRCAPAELEAAGQGRLL